MNNRVINRGENNKRSAWQFLRSKKAYGHKIPKKFFGLVMGLRGATIVHAAISPFWSNGKMASWPPTLAYF